jgi:basic membrane protein A
MRNRRRVLGVLLAVCVLGGGTVAASAIAKPKKQSDVFKAAWIYVGPHNDHGWSQAHDQGRLAVQKAFGSKVQTTYKELVPEGPQASQIIESLIRDGNKIIFSTSFGFQPFVVQEAAKHPDVYFEQATGDQERKNVAEYFGAGEEPIYLTGIAAGAATKKGTIGYVVAYPIPEVIRHANAFTLGAQLVRPDVKVKLVWTHSWIDQAKDKAAAQALVAVGADVLAQNVDYPAVGQYAESVGVPWVGYDADARQFAPKSWLTAALYNWGGYYVRRVRDAMNGKWKTGFYYGNMKDGFASLAPYGPRVSAKTKALIAAKKQAIIAGKFQPLSGPLYDQTGKLRVPKGHVMTVKERYAMNWLVKGVIGSPKG